MMQLDVSVVIACYLGSRWISQTIESVLNQTHPNLEVIIVNDASPDDCADILERYHRQDPRIRVLTNPTNLGIARTNNRGLGEVRGRYFCILDQDDLWKPEKAARQLEYLDQRQGVDVVYSRIELIDAEGRSLGERVLPDPKEGNLFFSIFSRGQPVPLASCMFRSSLLQRIGKFNESLKGNEDFDFALRVSEVTRWGFLPEILIALRHMPGTFSDTDTMVFDQFRLADLLEATWPQHPDLLRRYRSAIHYRTAHYLVRTNRLEQARAHFLKAAMLRPFFLKAWCLWTIALLPPAAQKFLPGKLGLRPERYRWTVPSDPKRL